MVTKVTRTTLRKYCVAIATSGLISYLNTPGGRAIVSSAILKNTSHTVFDVTIKQKSKCYLIKVHWEFVTYVLS